MSYLSQNIRFLRKKANLTQALLAEKVGVKRAVIGTYEEAKAEPKLNTLRHIAKYFGFNIHELVELKLDSLSKPKFDLTGQNLRILPVTISKETGVENVTVVPVKASAGYMAGYGDPDFVESLPQFKLPFQELSQNRTYRIFQIEGDSMHPIASGSYIIAEYIQNWSTIQDHQCHIVITKNEGVVYKRVINKLTDNQELILISDNQLFEPYKVLGNEILEVWKALGVISFSIPSGKSQMVNLQHINDSLSEIKADLKSLKMRS
ncbi:MAG: helix-turn-helix domain-containing protein [Bacteroidia bacterium]